MGCGSSAHPPKRETRAHSQVTVAAQQRAEAAYRRQRMAQEREQTAVLRAEMEVERARMLKEMSGGSRRPSYCIELEDLKEEAPDEVRENLEKCLNDYSVDAKNARNSLSNGYSRSAVIMKSESRGEKDEHQNSQKQARGDDENGNKERRNSTGEHNDQDAQITEKHDLLETIKDRSAQASPSNVCIEENEQTREHSANGDKTLDLNAGVVDRSTESKQNEDVSITDNEDASQNQSAEKPANNCNIVTIANEDSSMTHEQPTTNDEILEIKMEDSSGGPVQVQDTTNNVNSDGSDIEPVKMADDLNAAENNLSLNSKESVKENEQQQGIQHGDSIDNSSDQTRAVENASTTQNLESLHREHEDAVLGQSSNEQEVTS
ncbi:hypothetical protein ACROYT_G003009 [Oculina patagonica]